MVARLAHRLRVLAGLPTNGPPSASRGRPTTSRGRALGATRSKPVGVYLPRGARAARFCRTLAYPIGLNGSGGIDISDDGGPAANAVWTPHRPPPGRGGRLVLRPGVRRTDVLDQQVGAGAPGGPAYQFYWSVAASGADTSAPTGTSRACPATSTQADQVAGGSRGSTPNTPTADRFRVCNEGAGTIARHRHRGQDRARHHRPQTCRSRARRCSTS
jgi:hypothetical protein